jgi:U2 small nuclear ribonucleoprotein A'
LFEGSKGQELLASLGATLTSAEQAAVGVLTESGLKDKEKKTPKIYQGPSEEETKKIKEALSKATTLEEITRLERMLQTGQVPQR